MRTLLQDSLRVITTIILHNIITMAEDCGKKHHLTRTTHLSVNGMDWMMQSLGKKNQYKNLQFQFLPMPINTAAIIIMCLMH